jgi:formiminotetrahydrofolate cyclodeaminase
MPAGVAAATVTASIGLALFLKVLAIAGKRQPIPGLAGVARRHLLDLQDVVDADTAAFHRYAATKPEARAQVAAETIQIPLKAARSAAGGVELCAQAAQQVTGWIEADLRAAAAIIHASTHAMIVCVNANLSFMPLDDQTRREMLDEARQITAKADSAYRLLNPDLT